MSTTHLQIINSYNKSIKQLYEFKSNVFIMVIDIETALTGEIIQIAYNIYNMNFELINQNDYLINENIGKVDYYGKYSIKDIIKDGLKPMMVFLKLKSDIEKCSLVIGHNIAFDISRIDKYFNKLNITYNKPKMLCTMYKSKSLCNLVNIKGKPKSPKLSELYFFCFNEDPDNTKTHTADYDIDITYKCFKYLYERKLINLNERL